MLLIWRTAPKETKIISVIWSLTINSNFKGRSFIKVMNQTNSINLLLWAQEANQKKGGQAMSKQIAIVIPVLPTTWHNSLCVMLISNIITALPRNWIIKKVTRLLVTLMLGFNQLSSMINKNKNNVNSIITHTEKAVLVTIKLPKQRKANIYLQNLRPPEKII